MGDVELACTSFRFLGAGKEEPEGDPTTVLFYPTNLALTVLSSRQPVTRNTRLDYDCICA